MAYRVRQPHIVPTMQDFEKVESARSLYRNQLIQLYKPGKKETIFIMGRAGRIKPSKREVPGTDKKDFAIYLTEALDRPELIFDSYLYLEKKDEFGTTLYIPRILADETMFVLMDVDKDRLEKFEKYLDELDKKLENNEITQKQYKKSIADWQKKD